MGRGGEGRGAGCAAHDLELAAWTARLGAITAEALALHGESSLASARARLANGVRAGLLERWRPLAGRPTLYTATARGARLCGEADLAPCRVSASGAVHLITCARVAAELELTHPSARVVGERELRRQERAHGGPLASATLRGGPPRERALHRPDLLLLRCRGDGGLRDALRAGGALAIEVELTLKAGARLERILSGWGGCELVGGVLYLCSPPVARALPAALARSGALGKVRWIELGSARTGALASLAGLGGLSSPRGVAAAAPARPAAPRRPATRSRKPSQAPRRLAAGGIEDQGDRECPTPTSTG
ncbi:MAG: hypothetical protein ACYCUM_12610 [Solirubrobacteraceae bacterium]